jgi:multiple sugar transport system permease protein
MIHLLLLVVVAFSVIPLWWAFVASLTPAQEIFSNLAPLSWKAFVPIHPTLNAYVDLFAHQGFARVILNSTIIVIATLAVGLPINALAGFAFAKFDFAGKDAVFLLVIITFMMPFEAIAVPLYVLVKWLGWTNSFAALIAPVAPNGLVIFIFRQLYAALPNPIIESAKIDGASWSTILLRVVSPLSKPALIAGGLILFVYQWEAFLWPLIAANTPSLRVIQVALGLLQGEYQTLWDRLFAGIIVSVILPIAILLPLQRYYISGLATTGFREE